MFLKSLLANKITLPLIALLFCLFAINTYAAEKIDNPVGLTNFSFASYLGTGFYTTSGQNVFVLQMPFEYTIKDKTDTQAGWLLNLPITIGFINFDSTIIEDIPELSDVGTITFLPGLEFQYPVTPNWTLIPFADYGFARDLNSTTNVLIIGSGIKSYYNVHFDKSTFTMGNRFLYARERTQKSDNDSDYTLIETGFNFRFTSLYSVGDEYLHSNFYYINFYYPDNLVFFEKTPHAIRVGVEHELGITISNIPDFLFFKKPQLGIGVRFSKNINVYRLVFGAPF